MFLTFLFWLVVGYFAFRFLFGFLIPMIRTTRQVRRSFREMNERMGSFTGQRPEDANGTSPSGQRANTGTKPPSKEDYIDFEEIKD